MYNNENKTIDTTWNLKWKTSTEDWLVEALSLIRKQKKPTQEQQYALAKARECHRYWISDDQDWIKQGIIVPYIIYYVTFEENQTGN